MQVESLINARWVIPVEPERQVLEHHSIAVVEGHIHAILPTVEARAQFQARRTVDLPRHALIPGLVNAHTHVAMSLFRGLADDLPLMTWLQDHIWPAERRWVHEEFVADGTRLAIAEMLRGGTTCFNDMYFFPDVTGQVAAAVGMRAVVGLILIDFPSAWAERPEDYLTRAIEVHDRFRNQPLVSTAFAPHAPYSVSDDPLSRMLVMDNELELPIHMHVHETRDEVRQGVERYGMRPLARLDRLGLLGPSLVAVHMTQLEEDEIEAVARAGSHVIHCPESNLKLASGLCPVARLQAAGVNVALGTDGAASNNDLDMLGEMRSAALLGKSVADDPSALPAHAVLQMATLNGARALGLAAETGSLVPGKAADIAAIDLGQPQTQPVYDPVSQIVYAAGREQVSDVWVAGRRLVSNGRVNCLDLPEIVRNAERWRERIAGG